MKKTGRFLLLLLVCSLLSGCALRKKQPLVTVVERVDVTCVYQGESIVRTYSQSRKKTAVLNYLRWLRPQHKADCNPDTLAGDVYEITVHLSDGKQTIYRQKTNGYLKKNDEIWKMIDPEKGEVLHAILVGMESD